MLTVYRGIMTAPDLTRLAIWVPFAVATLFVAMVRKSLARRIPYPPGPPGLPIVGNLFTITQVAPWRTYATWSDLYGDLIHFSILGQDFLLLNSEESAADLLEKRSKVYSSRPEAPMTKLMHWDINIVAMPYGDTWRAHRRVFHENFRPQVAKMYMPTQMAKVHELLRKICTQPDDFPSHIRRLAGSLIMKIVYGYDVQGDDDHIIHVSEQAVAMFGETTQPGSTLVNIFPTLRHLPTWFPGVSFHRFAQTCAKLVDEMRYAPWNTVQQQMADGTARPSIVADMIARKSSEKGYFADEGVCRDAASVAFAASQDTTVAAFSVAMLVMITHPEAAKRAQAEIDAVVGVDRLPTFDDRKSLPYIEAFYREVMRWHPITPLSFSGATTEDDVYRGYFIPKGTIVVPNVWAMTHNAHKFPDAETFRPERYFTDDGQLNNDDTILAFGHGRRVCPGRHFADATLWALIVSVLAVFDVKPHKRVDGQEEVIEPSFTDGLISHSRPFKCSITPRSAAAEQLAMQTSHEEAEFIIGV